MTDLVADLGLFRLIYRGDGDHDTHTPAWNGGGGEFCIKNDDFCIINAKTCIKNDEVWFKIDDSAGDQVKCSCELDSEHSREFRLKINSRSIKWWIQIN